MLWEPFLLDQFWSYNKALLKIPNSTLSWAVRAWASVLFLFPNCNSADIPNPSFWPKQRFVALELLVCFGSLLSQTACSTWKPTSQCYWQIMAFENFDQPFNLRKFFDGQPFLPVAATWQSAGHVMPVFHSWSSVWWKGRQEILNPEAHHFILRHVDGQERLDMFDKQHACFKGWCPQKESLLSFQLIFLVYPNPQSALKQGCVTPNKKYKNLFAPMLRVVWRLKKLEQETLRPCPSRGPFYGWQLHVPFVLMWGRIMIVPVFTGLISRLLPTTGAISGALWLQGRSAGQLNKALKTFQRPLKHKPQTSPRPSSIEPLAGLQPLVTRALESTVSGTRGRSAGGCKHHTFAFGEAVSTNKI